MDFKKWRCQILSYFHVIGDFNEETNQSADTHAAVLDESVDSSTATRVRVLVVIKGYILMFSLIFLAIFCLCFFKLSATASFSAEAKSDTDPETTDARLVVSSWIISL